MSKTYDWNIKEMGKLLNTYTITYGMGDRSSDALSSSNPTQDILNLIVLSWLSKVL